MTREEAINEIKSWAIPSKNGREVLETLIPELRENKDENVKNKSGYYKAGKFWKASTLWNATKNKIPQRVSNKYILQECTWNIGTLQRFADEVKNVQEVSLNYPIILDMNGNIIDGAHRVVKAYLEGKDIDIIYLGDDEWPEPDYDEEKAVKESEDERVRESLIKFLTDIKEISESGRTSWAVRKEDAEMCKSFLAWLEKQKEQKDYRKLYEDIAQSEWFKKAYAGKSLGEEFEQKEQRPILEVFGFKVGDAVRLKDGDGRKHIIKSFEEVEGLHGPNFYHVEFEDNSARDGIYPGEEYSNGYYTQMEKFEDDQQSVPFSCGHENGQPADPVFSKQEYESYPIISEDTTSAKQADLDGKALLHTADKSYQIGFRDGVASVKPAEWSEEDEKDVAHIIRILDDCYAYGKHDLSKTDHENLVGTLKSLRPSWKPNEEQMAMLLAVINEPNNAGAESCHLALKSLHEHLKKLM